MIKKSLIVALSILFVSFPAIANDLHCSPVTGNGCIFLSCYMYTPGGPAKVFNTTEAVCALCDDAAETFYYGYSIPGAGTCISTTAANFCTSPCDWCQYVIDGHRCTVGGGGVPAFCDPDVHGPIPQAAPRPDSDRSASTSSNYRPPAWRIHVGAVDYLILKYDSTRSVLPALGSAFDGLYFVKQAGTRFGELGADRAEMAAKIVILFSSIDNGQPEIHTEVPDISLDIDHPHTAPLVRVGHWSAVWTAVPPLNNAKAFFYAQIYARILLDDRPASIEDLMTAGLNPIPMQ